MISERHFEDIICKYPHLIEENLTLKGRQVHVYGKIIDILFEDRFGQKLIVELKIGPIDRKHIGQVMEYEGNVLSEEEPTARIMLVGNRVPPNLKKALDHHGIEWKEISLSQLSEFLKNKSDLELLGRLEELPKQALKQEQLWISSIDTNLNHEAIGIWMFQVNQRYYRFFDLIRDDNFNIEWWHIAKHRVKIIEETKNKHIMLFWLTNKTPHSKDAGIYAIGEVSVEPRIITREDCVIDYCTPEYHKKFPDGNLSCPHIQCRLIKEFKDRPVLKECLLTNSILKDLSVINRPWEGANFRVTNTQWEELKKLIF